MVLETGAYFQKGRLLLQIQSWLTGFQRENEKACGKRLGWLMYDALHLQPYVSMATPGAFSSTAACSSSTLPPLRGWNSERRRGSVKQSGGK
ncbi:hypothetical protein MHYP_G00279400 [Metynnis hypsauchen]